MEETTRIENKLQLTPELDIKKEVIAFLNYKEGSIIYIGVDKEDRITLMASVKTSDHASDHASVQVKKLILAIEGEMDRAALQEVLKIKNRDYFRMEYITPAIAEGYLELTVPDKPKSKNQKYRLTTKGLQFQKYLKSQQ